MRTHAQIALAAAQRAAQAPGGAAAKQAADAAERSQAAITALEQLIASIGPEASEATLDLLHTACCASRTSAYHACRAAELLAPRVTEPAH